jgi:hypothetical protein
MKLNQGRTTREILWFSILLVVLNFGCQKTEESSVTPVVSKFLYIASGGCNSGSGITTFTSANSSKMLSKLDMNSKILTNVLDLSAPYQGGSFAPETGAQSVIDDGESLLLLTENPVNAGERRIYSVPKASPYNTAVYANDALAFTATSSNVVRAMDRDSDGSILFSKSVAIEKIGSNSLRIPNGTKSWVNAPAAPCATATTLMSAIKVMPAYSGANGGKILFAHQGTTAAVNRLGIISADGYTAPASCFNGYQITSVPHTNAPNVTGPLTFNATNGVSPTAMVYIPPKDPVTTGSLVVAYSSSAAADLNNSTNLVFAIVVWTVTETSVSAASLTNPVVLYNSFANIFGISAMAFDPDDSSLYVATASQAGVANQATAGYGYKVEKFSLDLATPSLTLIRDDNLPFLDRSSATKCISGLTIGS